MSLFAATLSGLGLSQAEAAEFLGVRIDTVKSWCQGRRTPAAGAWEQLHELAQRQAVAAHALVASIAEARAAADSAATIDIALPDDDEIRRRGWPCDGAFLAVIRRAWERLPAGTTIVLVPIGATQALRAAERVRSWTPD